MTTSKPLTACWSDATVLVVQAALVTAPPLTVPTVCFRPHAAPRDAVGDSFTCRSPFR